MMVKQVDREEQQSRGLELSVVSHRRLTEQVAELLRSLLAEAPFVKDVKVEAEPVLAPGFQPDLRCQVATPDGVQTLIVEAKRVGQPSLVRQAAQTLNSRLGVMRGSYGVIAVPYLTDRGRAVCREFGLGSIDLAGNAFLSFGRVFIDRRGRPNPEPERRRRKSLFAPKSARIIRVLLSDPARRWYVRDLAVEARVSLAQTSQVKRLLLDQDLAAEERRAFRCTRPSELLKEWASQYRWDMNEVQEYYSLLRVPEIEARIAEECERKSIQYALTLFSGADRVAPYTRYNRAFAYIEAPPTEVADALDAKPVPSGPNLVLLRPYDSGVYYGSQRVGRVNVVSDLQLYLDLVGYRGRGEEAARFLYERRIEPRWQTIPSQATTPQQ